MVLRVVGPISAGLGREGIRRTRGQDDEVRCEHFSGGEDDPGAVDLGSPVMDDPPVGEEPVIGDEDGGEKAWVHQAA